MSKEFDDFLKNFNHRNNELEILKTNISELNNKIDLILEILNNFTLMVFEEEEDDEDSEYEFDSDQTWVPEEDDEEDDWNNHEDDS